MATAAMSFFTSLLRPLAGLGSGLRAASASARGSRRRNRRKEESRPRLQLPQIPWRQFGILSIAALVTLAAALGLRASLNQPLESIHVEGRFQRVSRADVERAVLLHSRGEGLVAIDLAAVRAEVESIPWVDEATVRRAWPRGLAIFVVEQTPVARWGDSGLLNIRGEIFSNDARHIPAELPQLAGPPGTELQVTTRYLSAQGRLIEQGLRLAALTLDERGAWEMRLDNGITLRLGRRQVDERFERFVGGAARIVAQRATEISYVDLRYTNGFAIGWRTRAGAAHG